MRPVVVRIPDDLYEALKESAAASDRSVSQEMRYALRLYLGVHTETQTT